MDGCRLFIDEAKQRKPQPIHTWTKMLRRKEAKLLLKLKGLWTWRQQVYQREGVRGGGRNQKF